MRRMAAILILLALGGPGADAATVYTVKGGDTLDGIARQHGTTVAAITAANNLARPDLLTLGQRLTIPDSPGAARKYTVEAGDTLGDIAKDNGVSLQALLELNRMDDPDSLTAGQPLLIPQPGQETAAAPRYSLPAELRGRLNAIPVRAGRWRFVVIHHSATREGSARSMEIYHRQKRHMENGLAYHFVIGNGRGMPDGQIVIGDRWKRQIKGGHLASERLNEISIGICLVGNFESDRPTVQQMRSLYALVGYLMQRARTGPSTVKLHRQINTKPTKCPGRNFPESQLRGNL
jgi:LysM repeat protein